MRRSASTSISFNLISVEDGNLVGGNLHLDGRNIMIMRMNCFQNICMYEYGAQDKWFY